jgi:hypothetical protein
VQKANKLFLYLAMISLACLLSGLALSALDRFFPSHQSPVSGPNGAEIFIGSSEGLTLMKVGLLGFVLSAIICLVLTVIQKVRKGGSSA